MRIAHAPAAAFESIGGYGWKLYYGRSNDEEHVVDLGNFHSEGELLIAADDKLAELLEWPELAEETTLLRRQSRQVGSAGDSS